MSKMELRKSQPTASEVHVNTPLTNMSEAYIQREDSFAAHRVFPAVPVSKQSGKYFSFPRGYFNRDEMSLRAPGAESVQGGYGMTTGSYDCDVYSFKHPIPRQVRANTDSPLDPDRNATQFVTRKALIKLEKLWVNAFFAASLWTSDLTGGTDFTKWDDDSSTPVEDIREYKRTIRESTGYEPNKLVLGRYVKDALVDHPDIVARISGSAGPGNPAIVTLQQLAALFEVEEVLVTNAVENTADEGASDSGSFIAGKHALLAYSNMAPAVEMPSAGYRFAWTGYLGENAANGQSITRWWDQNRKSDMVEIEIATDMKLISADLGAFFGSAVS